MIAPVYHFDSSIEVTLCDMDEYIRGIYHALLYEHNKTKSTTKPCIIQDLLHIVQAIYGALTNSMGSICYHV